MQYCQCILPTYFVKWRPPPRVKKKRDLLGQEYRCSSHPEFQTVFQNHKYRQWEISWVSKQLFKKSKNCRYNTRRFSRKCQGKKYGVEQSAYLRVERRKELQSVRGGAKRSATTTTTTNGDRKQQLVYSLISSFGIAINSGKCLHAMPKIWKKKL